ncbi:MAG: SAM-dependent methyltransferase [candidate division WOR-3 bacterium]
MKLSEIVKELLYGEDGYYTKYVSIGKRGDFFTAPHTSPLFGYTVGRFLKREGVKFFVEIGGGEGYMMEDILNFTDLEGVIYEISPKLKKIQGERLKKFGKRFKHIEKLLNADAYVLNEVIDALPFNRFVFKGGRWWEYEYIDGEWVLMEGEPEDFGIEPPEGFIYDETENLESFLKQIFENTKRILIFDYGYEEEEFPILAPEGTLSGYKEHKVYYGFDALKGGMDITHFVNFTRIKRIAEKYNFKVKIDLPQTEFLLKFGILDIFYEIEEHEKAKLSGGLKTLLFSFKNHRALYLTSL